MEKMEISVVYKDCCIKTRLETVKTFLQKTIKDLRETYKIYKNECLIKITYKYQTRFRYIVYLHLVFKIS